jgi:hypothetical protein
MNLSKHFHRIGAQYTEQPVETDTFNVSVRTIEGKPTFVYSAANTFAISLLHINPATKHLLLMVKSQKDEKHKILCGFDERGYFAAEIPKKFGVKDVTTALEALKPGVVLDAQVGTNLKAKYFAKRKTLAYIRQGEWFFIPMPTIFKINPLVILKDEPIQRGTGKPHMCEEFARIGGQLVYVTSKFQNGLTQLQYEEHVAKHPEDRKLYTQTRTRDAMIYARGRITHRDHKTLYLDRWHRVASNTEVGKHVVLD